MTSASLLHVIPLCNDSAEMCKGKMAPQKRLKEPEPTKASSHSEVILFPVQPGQQSNSNEDHHLRTCENFKQSCACFKPANLPVTKNPGHCSYILQARITSHPAAIPLSSLLFPFSLTLICRGNEAQSPAEELRAAQGTLQCKCQVITRKLGEWKHTG